MKYSINFSDRHGNETDNIEVTISENSIEIPDLDFNGTLDTLYKTRGFFVETGTVSLPVGKKIPKRRHFLNEETSKVCRAFQRERGRS